MAAKDAIQATRTKITLLPEEEGVFAGSGVEKFPRLLRFSTINVVKAGWMVKNDGTWTVTDAGMKAYNDYSDPEAFYKQARKLYLAWKKTAVAEVDDEDETEDDVAEAISLELTEDVARHESTSTTGARVSGLPP